MPGLYKRIILFETKSSSMLKRHGRQTIIKTTGVQDSVSDIALGNKKR